MKKKDYKKPLTELIQTCHESLMDQTSWFDGNQNHHIIEGNPDPKDSDDDYYAKSYPSFNVWDEEE